MSVFGLGRVVATPAALAEMAIAGESPSRLIARHQSGDWGEVDAHDRRENEQALKTGARLLSSYPLWTGAKVWIITESDRSSTTILLPEEY